MRHAKARGRGLQANDTSAKDIWIEVKKNEGC